MNNTNDMIPASKVYELFGVPRAAMRELSERGIIRSVERQIDICHRMVFYSKTDLEKYINGNA